LLCDLELGMLGVYRGQVHWKQ